MKSILVAPDLSDAKFTQKAQIARRHAAKLDVVYTADGGFLLTLAAAQGEAADRPYSKAIDGVDFSDCATRAVSIADALVGTAGFYFGDSYHVPFKGLRMRTDRHGSPSASDRDRIEHGLRAEIGTWAAACEMNEEDQTPLPREGSVVNISPQVAKEIRSGLICAGAHSGSWRPSGIRGSTAGEPLSYADFDILTAPL